MCEPITITSTTLAATSAVMSAVGAAASFVAQQQNAQAQAKYQKQVFEQNKALATRNAIAQYSAIQERVTQENSAAADAILQAKRAAKASASTAAVVAGERGGEGQSAEAMLNEFGRTEGEYASRVIANRALSFSESNRQMKSAQLGLESNINAAAPKPVQQPSFAQLLIDVGGAAVQGAVLNKTLED